MRVLVVDDEVLQCRIMSDILTAAGYSVAQASNVNDAVSRIKADRPAVVLTDLKMEGRSGLELVGEVIKMEFPPEIVVITAFGSVETAVAAMKMGAYDYVTKPLGHDQLVLVVERAGEKYRLRSDGVRIREEHARKAREGLIGESAAMRGVVETAEKVAGSDCTVLIRGESGTGKERIARLVHYAGARGTRPLQTVNCAAFSENLLESELFGYEKGAFTGALTRKQGIIEAAAGSTLFLDEIGDMSLNTQAKVLRLLQEKEIRPVGSTVTATVDVRIIAATNKNLEEMTRAGTFREDLFYRLNVLPLIIPPLRQRREDIPLLIEFFLKRRRCNRQVAPEAMARLCAYSWPGNVRELEAVMERVMILSSGTTIALSDLPEELRQGPEANLSAFSLPESGISFEDFERSLLEQALARSNGVIAEAARLLGMTYRTFQYRAEKFGISRRDETIAAQDGV